MVSQSFVYIYEVSKSSLIWLCKVKNYNEMKNIFLSFYLLFITQYPNPYDDIINFNTSIAKEIASIYNSMIQLVSIKKPINNSIISKLPFGVYVVIFNVDGKTIKQ